MGKLIASGKRLSTTKKKSSRIIKNKGRLSKQKGARNERRAVKWYEAQGARCVKAGGSLGFADIVVVFPDRIFFVQVKTNRWPRPQERKLLLYMATRYRRVARVVCLRWDDNVTVPQVNFIEEFNQ